MSDTILTDETASGPSDTLDVGDDHTFADESTRLPMAARYAASLFLVAMATAMALAFQQRIPAANLTLFFVPPVVLAATLLGWGPSMAAVAAGLLAFDFFFTEPKYSFAISNPADILSAGLLLVTAIIVSAVAAESRRRGDDARRAAAGAEALRALAHMVIEARPGAEIIQASAATLNQVFRAPAVIFVERAGLLALAASAGGAKIGVAEAEAARECLGSRLPTRAETYPFAQSRFDFWPVTTPLGRRCVLGVDFTRAHRGRPAGPERSVDVVAAYLAFAVGGEG